MNRASLTPGLILVLAGVVLILLSAFGVGDNDTVNLAWLGAACGFLGVKIP